MKTKTFEEWARDLDPHISLGGARSFYAAYVSERERARLYDREVLADEVDEDPVEPTWRETSVSVFVHGDTRVSFYVDGRRREGTDLSINQGRAVAMALGIFEAS